jgi:WD40 repeat protein
MRMDISPNGKRLAAVSFGGTVQLWDLSNGQEVLAFQAHPKFLGGLLAFSPDSTRLASVAWEDPRVYLWDAATGQKVLTCQGGDMYPRHTDVDSVAFSPDGSRLATVSSNNTIKLWETTSGQELLALQGHPDSGWNRKDDSRSSVAFSPDGKRLACASGGTMMVLDASKVMPSARGKPARSMPWPSALTANAWPAARGTTLR